VLSIVDGNNNGSAITQYSYSLNNGTYVNFTSTSNPLTIRGLDNGSTYSVAIKSTNAIGTSLASNAVSVVPAKAPSAPTVTSVTAGDESVSIEFVSGDLNGGVLNGYMYSLNGSSDKKWAAGKSSPASRFVAAFSTESLI
jgi:titin